MDTTPTHDDRLRHAADLRARAALVREHGWEPYRESWCSGAILGVDSLLDEAAVDAAYPQWAPILWGTAKAAARRDNSHSRRWFAATANQVPSQMTEEERARWDAAKSALSDLTTGLAEGEDTAAVGAALSAARQAASNLDKAKLRDGLHIPQDTGEYEEELTRILLRIPDGWGRWVSLGRGWYGIIVQLDRELAAIDPHYELHRLKEKFGGLRVYVHTEHGNLWEQTNAAVDAAEERAAHTCERCGEPGSTCARNRWMKTLCTNCADVLGAYGPVPGKEGR